MEVGGLSGRFGFIGGVIRRILAVKSARGVSLSLSLIALSSKPLGYLRTLIIAWAFGTSAGMDAFYLANGIVGFTAASVASAMESAVLPELARLRGEEGGIESCESVFACISWFLIGFAALFIGVMLLAPDLLIRLFAGGFDSERARMGTIMLWWLIPFSLATLFRSALTTWALFTERYTISAVSAMVFNLIAIPVLLILAPLVGSYAVAGCISLGHTVTFLLFFFALRGVPLRVRRKNLSMRSLKRIGVNSLFSLALISALGLFFIVDRYFASLLPVGSVASISYATQMISIISLAAITPLSFFLAKASGLVAENPDEASRFVKRALSIAFAFFMPTGFFVAAAAKPIVSLTLGWGKFGADSVSMTSVCLAAYSIGMIFSIAGTILYRYAQASQRLCVIVSLTFLMVVTNGFLDWLFVARWGLLGLACATSLVQFLSFFLYFMVLLPDSIICFLRDIRFFPQLVLVSLCSGAAWLCGEFGIAAQLSAAAFLGIFYFMAAERMGFLRGVPENWLPSNLVSYFISIVRSLSKSG